MLEEMDAEMEQRCYAIGTKEKLGLTVNPHPINEDDILDCNGEGEDDFESCLDDDHQRLSSILESQGNVCKLHMELETWRSFQQLIKEQMEPGSVDGFAGECNSPDRKSITALDEGKAKQGIYSGNVVVNAAKTGRGVAELLMDSVSQSWRAKPNQKEFLNKIDEVEHFKKNDNGKRNEDFSNNDGLDKADSFKKANYFRRTEDLKRSNGNFKKKDDPEKNCDDQGLSRTEE